MDYEICGVIVSMMMRAKPSHVPAQQTTAPQSRTEAYIHGGQPPTAGAIEHCHTIPEDRPP